MSTPSAQIPFVGAPADALTNEVNFNWGRYGAGSLQFWLMWGRHVFRDSMAAMQVAADGRMAPKVTGQYPLQSMSGIYPLVATTGLQYFYKAEAEARTTAQNIGAFKVGPIVGERVDSQFSIVPLRAGWDPTGELERQIIDSQIPWGQHLPKDQILGLLVNGRVSTKHPAQVCYDGKDGVGKALFATDHPINYLDKTIKGPDGNSYYANTLTLPSNPVELGWAQVRDKIRAIPDLNGKTLPFAYMTQPEIYVATDEQALYWMRFVGGEKATDQFKLQPLVINGVPVGVSSVSLGTARIIVDPYLYAVAEDKADILKRAFVFPDVPYRMPFIFREEQTPITRISLETDWPGFNQRVKLIGTDAICMPGLGEPRSVFEVRTS